MINVVVFVFHLCARAEFKELAAELVRVGARVFIPPSAHSVNAPVSDVRVRCPGTLGGRRGTNPPPAAGT